jgi:hypothetical protein
LGYGDIIPNSKIVRMLTMCETLTGMFFLGFMFTLLAPAPQTNQKKKQE